MTGIHYKSAAALAGLLFMLAGCAVPPQTGPVIINEPVDAFNAVGTPYAPIDGRYHGTLATDVQRLQNARRLYQLAQERQRNAVERRQRACRRQSDARRVPIEGAPGEFFYCQPALNTRTSDVD